jgi:hypothetical protein
MTEKRIYNDDVQAIRILPSSNVQYMQYVETRMSRYPLYTISEYEWIEVPPSHTPSPSSLPVETRYERVYEYDTDNHSGRVIITLYTQSNGIEGGSVCIRNPVIKGIEKVVFSLLETMLSPSMKASIPIDNHLSHIVSKMRDTIPTATASSATHFPVYRLLEWKDVSYTMFATSTLVSMPQGRMVFYILSPEGTFLYDGIGYITPINTTPSSLTIMSGIWGGGGQNDELFHPLDIHVYDTMILSGYTYKERRSMIEKIMTTNDDILTSSSITSPDDIFSFFATHDRVYIIGERRYEWNNHIHIRVYVGEGGTPFGIGGSSLEQVDGMKAIPNSLSSSSSYVGDVVEVYRGGDDDGNNKVVKSHLLPMNIEEILTLLYYQRNRVSRDDITGKNCSLYTRYLERMMRHLYMFYRERGIDEVIDISSPKINPSYWRVDGMVTYALMVDERKRDTFLYTSRGYIDGDTFLGREGEVVVFDQPEGQPSVQAVDIILFIPPDVESYVLMSRNYVTTMLVEKDHHKMETILLGKMGMIKESSITLPYMTTSDVDDDNAPSQQLPLLLPRDPSCVERVILSTWRWEQRTHEVIREIYTPISPGRREDIEETPYGHLVRIGTLGISPYGDTSIVHAILQAVSPEYRRMDTISKTLYATRHKYPSLKGHPLYMIPPSSWSMYHVTMSRVIYKYTSPKTERTPGIVIMDNNGHWETLARPNVDGTLSYIW